MLAKISLNFGSSSESSHLEFEPEAMTIFVGPNNSGKSLILREIEEYTERGQRSTDDKIIEQLHFHLPQEEEATLIEKIRASNRYVPQLSLVVEVGGVIVGYAMFSYVDLVGEETWKVLGLAPVAVLPEFQRQGIGSALVKLG